MFHRLLSDQMKRSFLLFGPRGTGKSTWLKMAFANSKSKVLWFDLLEAKTELELSQDPDRLLERWQAIKPHPQWVVIDEVQKIPKLLDIVHRGIENHRIKFALTGSSARKLRRGGADLLAGRANEFHLHPLTSWELGSSFDLGQALSIGTLPAMYSEELESDKEKERFLYSYIQTYLREEIAAEQLVRRLEPFRRFLPVAAQCNTRIMNFSSIGRDAGVDEKQVSRYFEILFDTMLAFQLEPFDRSIRKRQYQKSKLYFFDLGIVRALLQRAELSVVPGTYEYGEAFETFVILEFIRLDSYLEKRFKFSYLRTQTDQEIDLVIERPRGRPLLVEFKSSTRIDKVRLDSFRKLADDVPHETAYWLSLAPNEIEIEGIRCLPWQKGLQEIFG